MCIKNAHIQGSLRPNQHWGRGEDTCTKYKLANIYLKNKQDINIRVGNDFDRSYGLDVNSGWCTRVIVSCNGESWGTNKANMKMTLYDVMFSCDITQ